MSGGRRAVAGAMLAITLIAQECAPQRCEAMDEVGRRQIWEGTLTSVREYAEPLWDVEVAVTLTAPSGARHTRAAFWDGGATWRVRCAPGEVGRWRWRSECSDATNAGLHRVAGEFVCVEAAGANPLYAHGPLRVSAGGTYLEHADGTPFFWLGDTAWNGVLQATAEEWNEYLARRHEQGFSVVQFVTTQWRGGHGGEDVFRGLERTTVNETVFQRMDERIAAINAAGLVAAPVMLWTLTANDPGQALSEESAVRLCRYMEARWGAHHVAWLLGGDGRYVDAAVERWRRIGRAVFGGHHDRPVTMHPCGTSWVAEQFGAEEWFDFLGYQSGHGLPEKTSRWIAMGPPAQGWAALGKPIINLEPNYEDHPAYGSDYRISPLDVRRAAWLSLLVTPTAGVTYGNNPTWVWRRDRGPAPNHPNIGEVGPWREGLEMPGIAGMTALRRVMEQIEWWRLRPAPELLAEQPGDEDATRFVAVAASAESDLVVAYTPAGGTLRMDMQRLPARRRWWNPREGGVQEATVTATGIRAPSEEDWVLVCDER